MTNVGVRLVLMLRPRDHFDLSDLPDDRAAELGILVEYPESVAASDAARVVASLIDSYGGHRPDQ